MDVKRTDYEPALTRYLAGPAGIPTQEAFSQNCRWPELDLIVKTAVFVMSNTRL
ncbi:hypothetical protein GCM10025855_42550 [Shewanella glacialipiscicola]|uniref:Uncharacterized protein n=1 Tax=Shewanella glacialipiscicola TaxID=614069 RepID=A0ABQ6J965_9GAMM|nr:hypothetical protein GCM10025855_42550 [Shewanella glacialipiscicola]